MSSIVYFTTVVWDIIDVDSRSNEQNTCTFFFLIFWSIRSYAGQVGVRFTTLKSNGVDSFLKTQFVELFYRSVW